MSFRLVRPRFSYARHRIIRSPISPRHPPSRHGDIDVFEINGALVPLTRMTKHPRSSLQWWSFGVYFLALVPPVHHIIHARLILRATPRVFWTRGTRRALACVASCVFGGRWAMICVQVHGSVGGETGFFKTIKGKRCAYYVIVIAIPVILDIPCSPRACVCTSPPRSRPY